MARATDIGARMVRAVLTNSTTITFDRAVGRRVGHHGDRVAGGRVEGGSSVSGGQRELRRRGRDGDCRPDPNVNVTRAVAFISTQGGGGQNMGRSPYVGDDILGVATATAALTTDQITLTRNSTVEQRRPRMVRRAVRRRDRRSRWAASPRARDRPVTQVIAHGLGQVPKAMILWTEGRHRRDVQQRRANIAFRGRPRRRRQPALPGRSVRRPRAAQRVRDSAAAATTDHDGRVHHRFTQRIAAGLRRLQRRRRLDRDRRDRRGLDLGVGAAHERRRRARPRSGGRSRRRH